MIIFLSGSINSGKSTIAKILIKRTPDCVNLEVDKICEFVDHIEKPEIEDIIFENVISLIKDYIKHGLNVIVSYPLSNERFNYWESQLKESDPSIYLFTLNPRLEIAMTERGERKAKTIDSERVKFHYQIGINKLDKGFNIDNSDQTPEETVNEILSHISH
jgi:broad-specificity NMP kinase